MYYSSESTSALVVSEFSSFSSEMFDCELSTLKSNEYVTLRYVILCPYHENVCLIPLLRRPGIQEIPEVSQLQQLGINTAVAAAAVDRKSFGRADVHDSEFLSRNPAGRTDVRDRTVVGSDLGQIGTLYAPVSQSDTITGRPGRRPGPIRGADGRERRRQTAILVRRRRRRAINVSCRTLVR